MILIADSGSTKCDWAFVDGSHVEKTSTMGFNPMFHSKEFIAKELGGYPEMIKHTKAVNTIFYYGAGCQNALLKQQVAEALTQLYPNAHTSVDHDLTACIRATCGHQIGIGCILGTGSNLAFFDGNSIKEIPSGLGYILGDEGSGTYFGKKLLADFLMGHLPQGLYNDLKEKHHLTRSSIMQDVYMKPHVNVYLAQFMSVLGQHQDEHYVQNLLVRGFEDFIKVHVTRIDDYREVLVHFVGSVAFHFKKWLSKACENTGISMGSVVQKPIDRLIAYHTA